MCRRHQIRNTRPDFIRRGVRGVSHQLLIVAEITINGVLSLICSPFVSKNLDLVDFQTDITDHSPFDLACLVDMRQELPEPLGRVDGQIDLVVTARKRGVVLLLLLDNDVHRFE